MSGSRILGKKLSWNRGSWRKGVISNGDFEPRLIGPERRESGGGYKETLNCQVILSGRGIGGGTSFLAKQAYRDCGGGENPFLIIN